MKPNDLPPNAPPSDEPTPSAGELPPRLLSKLKVEVEGYELLNPLGAGGQATVYRARRLKDGLIVAIKILHAGPHADEHARARLKRETRALLALKHPNIVHAIAAGRTRSGLECLVMNYIDGRPLDALWEDEAFAEAVAPPPPPAPAARLRLFKQICDTVQAAHRRGITHRDLSPSNILIDKHGQPHILDFGMASTAFDRQFESGRGVSVTGQFIGKIKYASPEQARGASTSDHPSEKVDIRSDVYALGVMLYQLLTNGAFPYEVVGNVIDVLNNIIHSKPRRPSELLTGAGSAVGSLAEKSARPVRRNPPLVNETIEAIVLKALEKDPDSRYQSAGELAADIDHYLAGRPISATAWSRGGLAESSSELNRQRLRRAGLFAGSTVLVLFLIGAFVMNFRTIVAWLGFSAASALPGMTPAALAQQEGSDRRLESLAGDLARVEARLHAVNSQLASATSRKPPELEEQTGGSGILSAADFCTALMKSASETGRELALAAVAKENLAREEQAEAERIGRETDQEILLRRRAELDAAQSALWARLAWGTFTGREADKLYRFRLKTEPNTDAATSARNRIIESGVKVRRLSTLAMDGGATALRPAESGGTDGTTDGGAGGRADVGLVLTQVGEQLRGALADCQKAAGAALDGGALSEDEGKAATELRKLAARLLEALDGCAESQANAAKAADEQARFTARARLQRDLLDAGDAASRFDDRLVRLAGEWKAEVDLAAARADVKLPAVAGRTAERRTPSEPSSAQRSMDPLAAWTVGSRWINSTPNLNATWTVRSRSGSRLEISRQNNKNTGILVVAMTVMRDGSVSVAEVFHRGDQGPSRDRNGRGEGRITSQELSLSFSAESSSDNGKTWNSWDETLNLTPESKPNGETSSLGAMFPIGSKWSGTHFNESNAVNGRNTTATVLRHEGDSVVLEVQTTGYALRHKYIEVHGNRLTLWKDEGIGKIQENGAPANKISGIKVSGEITGGTMTLAGTADVWSAAGEFLLNERYTLTLRRQ